MSEGIHPNTIELVLVPKLVEVLLSLDRQVRLRHQVPDSKQGPIALGRI